MDITGEVYGLQFLLLRLSTCFVVPHDAVFSTSFRYFITDRYVCSYMRACLSTAAVDQFL
jgi:hypothetical protein